MESKQEVPAIVFIGQLWGLNMTSSRSKVTVTVRTASAWVYVAQMWQAGGTAESVRTKTCHSTRAIPSHMERPSSTKIHKTSFKGLGKLSGTRGNTCREAGDGNEELSKHDLWPIEMVSCNMI